uniref:Uncharacterized protein n=1 Tax=Arundo donax TaxID=35708 RepID=A0A0A8YSS8_ARUDO
MITWGRCKQGSSQLSYRHK